MLVFNQQFSQHDSNTQRCIIYSSRIPATMTIIAWVSSFFPHTSWTNNLKYASEIIIITYHTWPPYQSIWWLITSVLETDLGRLEPVYERGEWVSQSVLQDTCTQIISYILATYTQCSCSSRASMRTYITAFLPNPSWFIFPTMATINSTH
jgi:hypothetical protein